MGRSRIAQERCERRFFLEAGLWGVHALSVTEPPAPPELSPPLELSRLFACTMQSLREIIGNHAGRHPASVAVLTLLWPYLGRLVRRFEALVRRVEAGTLPRPRAASLTPRVRLPQFGPPCLRRPGLPTSFAWLIRLVPYHAACIGGQVRYLLVKPEMAALFIAAPQVARIFRPLCRMLAVAPGLDLPPGLFKPRVRAREAMPDSLTAADACGGDLTPALSPKWEREKQVRETDAGLPASNLSTLPGNSPGRRSRRRLPVFREAPA